MLMLYHESRRYENLISEEDTILHFITNDKVLSGKSRNRFRKYEKYFDKLVKLNTKEQSDINFALLKIKDELIPELEILEKAWY